MLGDAPFPVYQESAWVAVLFFQARKYLPHLKPDGTYLVVIDYHGSDRGKR